MTLQHFLDHWSIVENPFLGEEARHDAVLVRLSGPGGAQHPDFEKILGDCARPTSAIVMGEKGSGKTAMRMQIASRVRAYNETHPLARVLVVDYDDLNPFLERFLQRVGWPAGAKGKDAEEAFERWRGVDHLDAILTRVVPALVDSIVDRDSLDLAAGIAEEGSGGGGGGSKAAAQRVARALRRLDERVRLDLLTLQSVYDRPEAAAGRTRSLRRLARLGPARAQAVWRVMAAVGWAIPTAFWIWGTYIMDPAWHGDWVSHASIAGGAAWVAALARHLAWDRGRWTRIGARIRKQVRVSGRTATAYARALRESPARAREPSRLPISDSEQTRFDMVQRLRGVLGGFGYRGILVLMDRVDEPALVNADPRRMRALVWPMLNHTFLQQEGIGFKLLLPTDLRHALLKESSAFFQEARLDKQSFVDRLGWTGPTLFELCSRRLAACRARGAPDASLLDLFAEDVTRQDLADALEQMHQPRDAFKFLYRCIQEHCSTVTSEQNQWRIPRHVLESVRRHESERVQQLHRGIRPA